MTEAKVLGGTDGFRGEARLEEGGPGIINEETFAGLTAALVEHVCGNDGGRDAIVVVGSDTRKSSESLRLATIAGARYMGAKVLDLGVGPTSYIQHTAERLGAAACVAVTASHNPASDNGWKGMIGSRKPSSDEARQISDRYWSLVDSDAKIDLDNNKPHETNHALHRHQYTKELLRSIRQHTNRYVPLHGYIIAVDGAYGAAQSMTADVLFQLGAAVKEYATDMSGDINDGCGAADLTGIKNFIRQSNFMDHPRFLGGVANDGDADRMLAVGVIDTHHGKELVTINGNHVLWAMAEDQSGIVGTEYTNSGLRHKLVEANIDFAECANGDRAVTEMLQAKRRQGQMWSRGGEFSGHFVDLMWLNSGDGVRSAAWLADWVVRRRPGKNFGDLYNELPLWHEASRKVDLTGVDKQLISRDVTIETAAKKLGQQFGPAARFILRASGTEPVYRIWAESRNVAEVETAVDQLQRLVIDRVESLKT